MSLNLSDILLNLFTLLFALLSYIMYKKYSKAADENIKMIKADADREALVKKEAFIAAKDAVKAERDRLNEEIKERKAELSRSEEKLIKREDSVAEKLQSIAERETRTFCKRKRTCRTSRTQQSRTRKNFGYVLRRCEEFAFRQIETRFATRSKPINS